MLKTWIKEVGITSIEECFYIEDAKRDIGSWFEKAEVSEKGYMLGYNDLKDPSVSSFFRFLSKIADNWMKIVCIRF